ncbi:MAG: PaaI family thioesterase [Myxococcales bacterium]|nr:PaaI family thioesterase [Myxococcales bacterium]
MKGLNRDEIWQLFERVFPPAVAFGFVIDTVSPHRAQISLEISERHLRPGGTVMGPTLMTMVDTAMYVALLATDETTLQAVTSNLNVHFLRRPSGRRLTATCEVEKLGKRQATGVVRLTVDDDPSAVAVATVAYSYQK